MPASHLRASQIWYNKKFLLYTYGYNSGIICRWTLQRDAYLHYCLYIYCLMRVMAQQTCKEKM